MTSFGWKRKAGAGVQRKTSEAFEKEAKDEDLDNEVTRGEVDWLTLAPKKRLISLEDARAKSERLRQEGATLAEAERYWEAIQKWDDALLLTPTDRKTLEMKAQALMAVGEVFPAVQTAQQAVNADPTWWEARQTLGRAQLNMGEVRMAVRSFSKAVMLNPSDKELWEDDLFWACSVRDRMMQVQSDHVQVTKTPSSDPAIVPSSDHICDIGDSDNGAASTADRSDVSSADTADVNADIVRRDSDDVDDVVRIDLNDRQTLLKVPPNYVYLRG